MRIVYIIVLFLMCLLVVTPFTQGYSRPTHLLQAIRDIVNFYSGKVSFLWAWINGVNITEPKPESESSIIIGGGPPPQSPPSPTPSPTPSPPPAEPESEPTPTPESEPEPTIGVYDDPSCSVTCSSIYWGTLNPGDTGNHTIYIRNEDLTPITLTLNTTNWDPFEAQNYLNLTWDYNGSALASQEVREITLLLHVDPDVTGITNFAFNIVINYAYAPKT